MEVGGVEAWKEQWDPAGLGGFTVSSEKLPPEPRGGGTGELRPLGELAGFSKIIPGKVGMALHNEKVQFLSQVV